MILTKKISISFVLLLLVIGMCGCNTGPGAFEPSKVDASSLKQLKGVSLDSPDEVKARLETLTFIQGADISDNPSGEGDPSSWQAGKSCIWSCSYSVSSSANKSDVIVGIHIYDTPENAAIAFKKNVGLDPEVVKRRKTVVVSDNIAAELYPAYQYRNADLFFTYDGRRFLNTDVWMGCVLIGFGEQPDSAKNAGKLTSENLGQICQALAKQ